MFGKSFFWILNSRFFEYPFGFGSGKNHNLKYRKTRSIRYSYLVGSVQIYFYRVGFGSDFSICFFAQT